VPLTSVRVRISNPSDRTRGIDVGMTPEKTERFSLADGSFVTR
jgi:hypothetical protein